MEMFFIKHLEKGHLLVTLNFRSFGQLKMNGATDFSVYSNRDHDHSKSECKQFQTLRSLK